MTDPKTRIPCDVPGCRRTAPKAKYPPGTRIICGKCWRVLTRSERAEFRAAQKAEDRETVDRVWSAAIERNLGL